MPTLVKTRMDKAVSNSVDEKYAINKETAFQINSQPLLLDFKVMILITIILK